MIPARPEAFHHAGYRVPIPLRLRAAAHELRCRQCRVTWLSWWRRLTGDGRGYQP